MDKAELANQLCVDTGCSLKWWPIGTDGQGESREAVLLAHFEDDIDDDDDDDDDIVFGYLSKALEMKLSETEKKNGKSVSVCKASNKSVTEKVRNTKFKKSLFPKWKCHYNRKFLLQIYNDRLEKNHFLKT